MAIKVKLFSLFRKYIDDRQVELEPEENKTIKDLINSLDDKYEAIFSEKLIGEEERINPGAIILVNGHNIHHIKQLDTELEDGDVVTIFPPSAGG
ncbi:MAG: ubiquitin-like small modifier protein 1 [Bacillota bacterium]